MAGKPVKGYSCLIRPFQVVLDMSIIGPRPHIPRYIDNYAKRIDKYEFVYRHSVCVQG